MKPIKIECPNCGQHIQLDPGTGKQGGMKVTMQIIALAAILAAIAGVVWWKLQVRAAAVQAQQDFLRNINPEKFETRFETQRRWEKEAEAAMVHECTNYVGFTRIIDKTLLAGYDADPTNWTGDATIDFINKTGGAERTNLLFRVWVFDHHAMAMIDEMAMLKRQEDYEQRREQMERELDAKYPVPK